MLARAITLVESERASHHAEAQALLNVLLPELDAVGVREPTQRVGISGVPGVGKSTFIDALGMHLVEAGHRVAVLAVDPSSRVTGGSILGDKTRMARLARDPRAFIRPSPSSGTLGGVARKTRETMLLCEAAGFDVVLVETVGVGQSETLVSEMVDVYLVLMLAGAGDELQGIKRGILEVADVLAINKADGDNVLPAQRAVRSYASALHLMRHADPSGWFPQVLSLSAREGTGLDALWQTLLDHRAMHLRDGSLSERRRAQQLRWMWALVEERLMDLFRGDTKVGERLATVEREVREGKVTATSAAAELLALFRPE